MASEHGKLRRWRRFVKSHAPGKSVLRCTMQESVSQICITRTETFVTVCECLFVSAFDSWKMFVQRAVEKIARSFAKRYPEHRQYVGCA